MPLFALTAFRYWKLIGLGLLLMLLAVQTVRLGMANNRAEREKIANNELRAELKAISTRKNEQKAETGKRIERSEKQRQISDKVAEKIERAPLPGNCATPAEIMGADL